MKTIVDKEARRNKIKNKPNVHTVPPVEHIFL